MNPSSLIFALLLSASRHAAEHTVLTTRLRNNEPVNIVQLEPHMDE